VVEFKASSMLSALKFYSILFESAWGNQLRNF